MNRRTIQKVLAAKFNAWVKTIDDPSLQTMVKNNTIITGGSIASLLLKEDVKDFDVYFRTKEVTKAVTNYYVAKFNARYPNTAAIVLDGDDPGAALRFRDAGFAGTANLIPGRIKIGIKSTGVAAENPEILREPFEDVYDVLNDADQINAEDVENADEGKEPYRPIFLSSNAITLANKVQLVIRFYGEPDSIHENYDFIHCTNYWTSWDGNLVLRPEALESLLSKQLRYVGSKYPVCSVIRTRKFIKRGFHINAGQYLKMMFQISQLDLKNINVLEDQLVGVDSAYFTSLINSLRTKQENDPNFEINDGYLASIVDRLF